MAVPKEYAGDVEAIKSRRHANGADFWATPDGRWGTGSPFSTFDCALMLTELGVKRSDPLMKGAAGVLLAAWRDDGRIRPAPKGAVYPCHTANAARVLCRLGYARDERLERTFEHFFEAQHDDGGWRCNTTKLGTSAVTDASNPGVTLNVLDAFRFTPRANQDKRLDAAAKTLLIGTLFGKVEFPFRRYNLFHYVYVLSFYEKARKSPAFRQALRALEAKLADGKLVVESPPRDLAQLAFCKKGAPSRAATRRYREILANVSSKMV
jgi:hypothetical protein